MPFSAFRVIPCSLLLALAALSVPHVQAATYHVRTNGSDSPGRNGLSAATAWRTVAYAASRVPASAGHVISIGSGTFTESSYIVLPPGVSLQGTGKAHTILTGSTALQSKPYGPTYDEDVKHFLIQAGTADGTSVAGNQTISDLTLDGANETIKGGLIARARSGVIVRDVQVRNFDFTGVWIWGASGGGTANCHVYNSQFSGGGNGSTGFEPGQVQISALDDSSVHDCQFTDTGRASDGRGDTYGIKALGYHYWTFRRLKIYNNRISLPKLGTWEVNPGHATPNIGCELWHSNLIDCEFYNNVTENQLSAVHDSPSSAATSIRIHHNTFNTGGGSSATECDQDGIEFDHNFVNGGGTPFAAYSIKRKNIRVHHNVLCNLSSGFLNGFYFSSGCDNLKVYNNTWHWNSSTTPNAVIFMQNGTSAGVEVKNDIHYNTTANTFRLIWDQSGAGAVSSPAVADNVLFGIIAPSGATNTITAAPQLSLAGTLPAPFYQPASSSANVVNSGSAPDRGAYEYGSADTVGATTPP